MREEDDLEGEREEEEEAEEDGPERVVDSWLFVRGRGLFNLARLEGEGGSVAFPFPLSIVFVVDSSSCSIASSVLPPLIALKLNSDPSTSTWFPLVVAMLLVELPALCLAVPILFLEFFPFDLSSSFPPPPSISCIFLLNKACAVPPEADPSKVEDEEGFREREEVEVVMEEEEGPTNN